jgi:hypothetical protein
VAASDVGWFHSLALSNMAPADLHGPTALPHDGTMVTMKTQEGFFIVFIVSSCSS